MPSLLRFLAWPTIAGVLAALLILDRIQPASDADSRGAPRLSLADAVNVATPSVVNIFTTRIVPERRHPLFNDPYFGNLVLGPRTREFEPERIPGILGSGVIMSETGYILTNEHVIRGADQILVMLHDGREALAYIIGIDLETDLAVLKIDLPNVEPIPLADTQQARVGDVVLAIGNPMGFGHSVSQGIISALGRYGLQVNTYENYIQTDATINQGNSGGALIDSEGRLLGINTLIYSNTGASIGIGLATPAYLARLVMDDIIEHGRVIRGWLGVSVRPARTADGSEQQSLAVLDVERDGPAARAGIRPGDLIIAINGEIVSNGQLTMNEIALLQPGESVSIVHRRGDQLLESMAVVGERPAARG